MTTGLMPRFISFARARRPTPALKHLARATYPSQNHTRTLANVGQKDATLTPTWFTSTPPARSIEGSNKDHKPPDERTLKLGKTIRVLHERLPTLLATPLPQDILSPQIKLHLFPSTHPHLPTVGGKIAYTAALWTAPVAWGRMPVVGNVKLVILSERLVQNGGNSTAPDMRHEKLIVKWKTCGKSKEKQSGQVDIITDFLGRDARSEEEFCGLFIFEFDSEGRILTHTIEHAEEGGSWDKTAKVISVTDWLLGRAWRRRDEEASLALAQAERGDTALNRSMKKG